MPPRWIGLPADAAGTPSYSYVLFERNTNDNLMFGNPHNFSTRLLHLRDMLEYFRTKSAIKRGVGSEIRFCYVPCNSHNSREVEARPLQVERRCFRKILCKQPRKMPVSCTNVEHRPAISGRQAEEIIRSSLFVFACAVFFEVSIHSSLGNLPSILPVARS